eukprot:COSAG04_NODE_26681_length_292_cov_0.611399_1_plen_97_part_11
MRLLLELGADHTAVGTGGDYRGRTALELAEWQREEEAAAVLREWALSHLDAQHNPVALRSAARAGETAEVRVLLAAGTDPDAADGVGYTALHYAAAN